MKEWPLLVPAISLSTCALVPTKRLDPKNINHAHRLVSDAGVVSRARAVNASLVVVLYQLCRLW